MKFAFNSNNYSMLECFVRGEKKHPCGMVSLYEKNGRETDNRQIPFRQTRCLGFPLEQHRNYELMLENVKVGEIYLSDCPDILNHGIKYLLANEDKQELISPDLDSWYDVVQREQYHFSPFTNWMNDPNGLCFYRGWFHIFYQKNPFDQVWGNMYWGHAASRDLIHWTHLPIALKPQQEILEDESKIGGAFSGSACEQNGELKLFFTRDLEYRNLKKKNKQSQATISSKDCIRFENEEEVIPAFSIEGASENFRDPKITRLNGFWYMVLGSQIHKKAAILLYKSEDLKTWEYLHPLIMEDNESIEAFECPDFFYLDGKYVITGAWMSYKDDYGRFNPMRYYIGSFEREKFTIETEGFCDFGCDYYASQTFYGCSRRISISWIPDWKMHQKEYPYGCKGSLSIPRELHIVNGTLHQSPIPEIYTLMHQELAFVKNEDVCLERIEGNSFYAKAEFTGETDFEILFARRDSRKFLLKKTGNEIEIIGAKEDARYITHISELTALEIFVDRRIVEIFLNNGESAGTKLILSDSKSGVFRTIFSRPESVKELKVIAMESIWK